MTDDAIQERILAFLDTRGGYVAGASERELFAMLKDAVAQTKELCAEVAEVQAGGHYMAKICAAAIRAQSPPPTERKTKRMQPTSGDWIVVLDEWEDGGVPLVEKWIECDGRMIARAPSNYPLNTPEGAQEMANLEWIAQAHNAPSV